MTDEPSPPLFEWLEVSQRPNHGPGTNKKNETLAIASSQPQQPIGHNFYAEEVSIRLAPLPPPQQRRKIPSNDSLEHFGGSSSNKTDRQRLARNDRMSHNYQQQSNSDDAFGVFLFLFFVFFTVFMYVAVPGESLIFFGVSNVLFGICWALSSSNVLLVVPPFFGSLLSVTARLIKKELTREKDTKEGQHNNVKEDPLTKAHTILRQSHAGKEIDTAEYELVVSPSLQNDSQDTEDNAVVKILKSFA